MPQKAKSINDLLRTLTKEELLALIQDCCLFWNVTEERIWLAKFDVARKRAKVAFDVYLAAEFPDYRAVKESVYHSMMKERAEAHERYERLQKRCDRIWSHLEKMRKK